eukprot:IDg2177t1
MSSATPAEDATNITNEPSDSASSALEKLVQAGSASVNEQLDPALTEVETSQSDLLSELLSLSTEMNRISTQAEQVGVDEYTQKRIAECKKSLTRSKTTMKTVNSRMRRLRTMDEAHRLTPLEIEMQEETIRCTLPNDGDEAQGPLRYMPKVESSDPIVAAVASLASNYGGTVKKMELLDSRWNGNEAFRIDLEEDKSPIFAKLNRVEDPSVFMSEAVGLTAMLNACDSMRAPKPLHIGRLPRVGDYGPGAFLLLEWFDLAPFGAQRAGVQAQLGNMIADMHKGGPNCERVHAGRFGFPANNFLALTPMDNTWMPSWPPFFAKRLAAQISAAFKNKPYGRAPLNEEDAELKEVVLKIVQDMDFFFRDVNVRPSLLHGDLWVGNVG